LDFNNGDDGAPAPLYDDDDEMKDDDDEMKDDDAPPNPVPASIGATVPLAPPTPSLEGPDTDIQDDTIDDVINQFAAKALSNLLQNLPI
jgi:hypothetical protein